jgi:hypothetical protein
LEGNKEFHKQEEKASLNNLSQHNPLCKHGSRMSTNQAYYEGPRGPAALECGPKKESNLKTETRVSICIEPRRKKASCTSESVMSRKNPARKQIKLLKTEKRNASKRAWAEQNERRQSAYRKNKQSQEEKKP